MNKIDVEPTAQIIDEMSASAVSLARDLNNIAKLMRAYNNIDYAAEAVSAVVNAIPNFRLDLMAARPIREFQRGLK